MTRLEELEQKLRFIQKEIEFLKEKEVAESAKHSDLSNPDDLTNCCCDWTNHCPVHGSTPIYNHDSYIAQP